MMKKDQNKNEDNVIFYLWRECRWDYWMREMCHILYVDEWSLRRPLGSTLFSVWVADAASICMHKRQACTNEG